MKAAATAALFTTVLWVAALWPSAGTAQEFKPYASTKITAAQWGRYYQEVKDKLGASMQERAEDRVIVFSDKATQTAYAFTQPGHPAHPAWVARQVVEAQGGIGIRQTGYFAGDRTSFAAMYRSYEELNDRIGDFMQADADANGRTSGAPVSRPDRDAPSAHRGK